jgi:hypothetical protein
MKVNVFQRKCSSLQTKMVCFTGIYILRQDTCAHRACFKLHTTLIDLFVVFSVMIGSLSISSVVK